MRWPILLLVPLLSVLACSGSSGSLASGSSIVGTWHDLDGSVLEVQSSGSCAVDVMTSTGMPVLCGDCMYSTSGSSLKLVVHTSIDGGTPQDLTCDCSYALSNGGNTLQITSAAGSSCPAFDVTLSRQTGGNVAFFCGQ